MRKFDKSRIIYFILAVFVIGLFLFFSYARVFDEFEFITLDLRYRLRPPQEVNDDIVIIEVSDDSIEKLEEWPFPRNYHALLVKALTLAQTKTVIFDIFFSEKKKGDEAFAEAIKEAGNVYLPYVFDLERHSPDRTRLHASKYAAPLIDILKKESKGTGFINVEPDEDGNVRRIPPFIVYKGKLYPHITVLAALNDLGFSFDGLEIIPGKKIIASRDLVIPLGGDSSMLVNYPERWGKAFRHYSYVDVLQSYLADVTGQEPIVDLDELKGAVCLVGITATAAPDAHPSPLEPLYPGVGVHASVYNSIARDSFLRRLNRWWNLLILAIMWLLTGWVTARSRKRFAFLSIFLIMVAFITLSIFFFWPLGIWIDVFYPLVTIVAIYVVFTFRKYVTETQKREILEKELNIARDIQQSFLPQKIPQVGNLDIDVRMFTARQVGGDLYDVLKFDDDRIGMMMGDVSGKGIPAALFMARVVSEFKLFAKSGSVSEVVGRVNDELVAEGGSNLFVTLTYMLMDTGSKKVRFSVGGHLPTIFVRPGGEVELLDVEEGMPLGLVEGDYMEKEIDYPPGSTFVLYTDGVTEAMNPDEEMFGQDRLVKLVQELKGRSSKEIVEAVYKAVMGFAGRAPQHDDITIMAIRT